MHCLNCQRAYLLDVADNLQVANLRHLCQHLECSLLDFIILDADSFENAAHDVVPLSVIIKADFSLSDHSQQSPYCNPANFELSWIQILNGAQKNQTELIKGQFFHELTEIAECLDCGLSNFIAVSQSTSV